MKFGTDLSRALVYNAANLKVEAYLLFTGVGLFQCLRQLKENRR